MILVQLGLLYRVHSVLRLGGPLSFCWVQGRETRTPFCVHGTDYTVTPVSDWPATAVAAASKTHDLLWRIIHSRCRLTEATHTLIILFDQIFRGCCWEINNTSCITRRSVIFWGSTRFSVVSRVVDTDCTPLLSALSFRAILSCITCMLMTANWTSIPYRTRLGS